MTEYAPTTQDTGARAAPIILLVYEMWDTALEALESYHLDYPTIWLVDNHSPTDRGDDVRRRFPSVRVIRTPRNGGWAYAYNIALRLAASEGHTAAYLLNSDAVPFPGAVDHAIKALRKTDRAAAVGSLILDWDGRSVEYDGKIHLAGEGPPATAASRDLLATDRVHGAGMAISIEAFKAIGPFFEDYFLYHEETDWMIRAAAAGWSLRVDGDSRIRHMAGGSDTNSNARYYRVRNTFIAHRRGVYLSGPSQTFWSLLIQQAGFIYDADSQRRTAGMQGIADGVRGRTGPRPPVVSRASLWCAMLPLRLVMKGREFLARTGPRSTPAGQA